MQRVHYGFEYTGPLDSFRLVPDVKLPKEVILERLGHILCGVSIMPARVEEYDAAHPPPEGFGRAFRLEVAVIVAGEVAAEEPAEGDEDDDVVAGPVVVAATGSGSSSARKRWTEVASKQSLPKRRCSTHQHPPTDGHSILFMRRSLMITFPLLLALVNRHHVPLL